MSDVDCTPGREPRSVAASFFENRTIDGIAVMSLVFKMAAVDVANQLPDLVW